MLKMYKRLRWYVAQPIDWRGLLLVFLAIGWLIGILLSSWLALPAVDWLIGIICLLLTTGMCWRKPALRYIALLLLFLCLGAWRYALVSPANDSHAISDWIGQKGLEVECEVVEEPRLEQNSTLLLVDVQDVSLDKGQNWLAADGEIEVQALGATFDNPYGPHYGDTIQLNGTLGAPPSYGTPELLASMAFPAISVRSHDGNPLLTWLYGWRTSMAGIIMQALPQPLAALLIALFLSLRTPALKGLIPFFNVTGTAHMVAPSGFKVTLLSGLISGGTGWLNLGKTIEERSLLPAQRRAGNWRRWLRTALVLTGIIIYTFLSGGGPAALRAGIMGSLLVLAPRLGRFYNVYTALALSAWLMSLSSAFVIWDTGFQLSFIGTLGIILFTPFFQRLLHFLTHLPLGEHIAEIIAVTLAAEVATLPIFALSFNQLSFIAPLANIATVPLLGLSLGLGALICLVGVISVHLAVLGGWLAYPFLWYISAAVTWCAHLPGAYLPVTNLNPLLAWLYYGLLAWSAAFLLTRQSLTIDKTQLQHTRPLVTRRTSVILQGSLALFILLGTGTIAQATQPDGNLTITVLSSGNPTQGVALLLRSPAGQTALIDEGASNVTLTQTLDAQLPFWQRSLNLVVLTDTSSGNLSGLQDVITRYQVAQIVDAGMLHPSVAYARWRRTLDERQLPYTQVRQGNTIKLGQQTIFQVLWPPAQLHKSSNEEHDNALILRLLAPGLQMLLLNSTVQSDYALKTLPEGIAPAYLRGEIVQISNTQGKVSPDAFASLLTLIHPSLLFITPVPARSDKRQAQTSTNIKLPRGSWQMLQTEQVSNCSIQSNAHGWHLNL